MPIRLSPFPSPPNGSPAFPVVPLVPWLPALFPRPRIRFPTAAVPFPSPCDLGVVVEDFTDAEEGLFRTTDCGAAFFTFSFFSVFGVVMLILFPVVTFSFTADDGTAAGWGCVILSEEAKL